MKKGGVRSEPQPSPRNFFPDSIATELCGTRLRSPTMLASGVLGISFDLFPRIIKGGAGAVVTKSIGLEPREGYTNPTMAAVDCGYVNAIGLANPGSEEFVREIREFEQERQHEKFPIIVSIFSDSPENFALLAEKIDKLDFFAFELNLSCPHVKDVGSEIGSDPEEAAEVLSQVRKITTKPLFAKMPANIIDVAKWAKSVEDAGADAIVAINTARAMLINVDTRKPVLSHKIGGLSGPAIRPIAVRCVFEIYESVKIPVIGVGGVVDWESAVEFFLAGASAVQIGSAMSPTFLGTFASVNQGIHDYIRTNNFSNVEEIVGLAHE